MNNALNRLLSVRVADAMSRAVVTISANATMSEAANTLRQHHISGAPVIDELEQCVGVLSTSDFANGGLWQANGGSQANPGGEFDLVRSGPTDTFHIEHRAEALVREHMCSAPQTIDSQQSLIEAAQYMTGQHVHRLVVLDTHARPVGVISSLDLVAALVKVVEEQVANPTSTD